MTHNIHGHHVVHSVWYHDEASGVENVLALIHSKNEDGTLNLVTFPNGSPVEHRNNVSEGPDPGQWHN